MGWVCEAYRRRSLSSFQPGVPASMRTAQTLYSPVPVTESPASLVRWFTLDSAKCNGIHTQPRRTRGEIRASAVIAPRRELFREQALGASDLKCMTIAAIFRLDSIEHGERFCEPARSEFWSPAVAPRIVFLPKQVFIVVAARMRLVVKIVTEV